MSGSTWRRIIDGASPLFRDHVISGQPLCPGAALLDFALQAGQALTGNQPSGLSGVRLLRPLSLGAKEQAVIEVEVDPEDSRRFKLYAQRAPDGPRELHMQGLLVFDGSAPPEPLDIERLVEGRPPDLSADAVYDGYEARGMHYGRAFRVVTSTWSLGPWACLTRLASGADLSTDAELLSPFLLDGALHSALPILDHWGGIADARGPSPIVPYLIERLERYAPVPRACWCAVRIIASPSDRLLPLEYRLYDHDGRPCVQVRMSIARLSASGDESPALPHSEPALSQAVPRENQAARPISEAALTRLVETAAGLRIHEVLLELGESGMAELEGRVIPIYRRLLLLLVDFAREDGALLVEAAGERPAALSVEPGAWKEILSSAQERAPSHEPSLRLLQRCLEALPAVLRGEREPLGLLFPGGNFEALEEVYRDAPASRRVAVALSRLLPSLLPAPGLPLRILEVGAGTGGTTAAVLPLLTAWRERLEYFYTDVSDVFLHPGRSRFAQWPELRFQRFDLERAVREQQLPTESFDLILAGHVVHATRSVDTSLRRLRSLLRPEGRLLLVEITQPRQRWANLIFGLLPGWWSFDGTDGRNLPLLTPSQWQKKLSDCGFRDASVWPAQPAPASLVVGEADPAFVLDLDDERSAVALGGAVSSVSSTLRGQRAESLPQPQSQVLRRRVREELVQRIATVLRTTPQRVRTANGFGDLGMDSILAQLLVGGLSALVHVEVPARVVYERPGIDALTDWMLEVHGPALSRALAITPEPPQSQAQAKAPPAPAGLAARSEPGEPIAIVGYAARLPRVPDTAALWPMLAAGVDAMQPVSAKRLGGADGLTSYQAGLLEDADRFDAELLGISRPEARYMDPQQRLVLELSLQALENAGYGDGRTGRYGVFFGASTFDYGEAHLAAGDPSPYMVSGLSHAMISNRVSYEFDLRGPSLTLDTVCSSSLVAVHAACRALRAGDCEVALAGGVNVLGSIRTFQGLAAVGALSPTHRCHTFSAAADGYARGEGAGVVVLKPLAQALSAGDTIHAIIRGVAVNQDGRTNGVSAPNPAAQEQVIQAAIAEAGVHVDSISYVEAHGTGTRLGDPMELQALAAAHQRTSPCAVGAIKASIGHLEAAAGIAGVLKVVAMLNARQLPPSLHSQPPNQRVQWDRLPFWVPTKLEPWTGPLPLRAGVSSFGFGGTNAHVILEEAPAASPPAPWTGPLILLLSAHTRSALERLRGQWLEVAIQAQPEQLADLCYTAAVGRKPRRFRQVVVFTDLSELRSKLDPAAVQVVLEVAGEEVIPSEDATLVELGAAWARGCQVDWARFFGPGRRRVPAPTTPREGQPFTLPPLSSTGEQRELLAPAMVELPAPRPPLPRVRFSLEGPVPIGEHRLAGKAVVPGAAVMNALLEVSGGGPGGLEAVRIHRPLVLGEGQSFLELPVHLDGNGGMEISGPQVFGAAREPAPFAQARRTMAEDQPASQELASIVDSARRRLPRLPHEQLWEEALARGLEHGPAFRRIESLQADGDEALALVTAPVLDKDAGAFPLNPMVADAAIMTAVASLGLRVGPGLWLPTAVNRLSVWQPLAARCVVYARLRAFTVDSGLAEVTILDESGQACARFSGLEFQRSRLGATGESGQPWLWEVGRRPAPLGAAARVLSPGPWLAITRDPALAAAVARRLAVPIETVAPEETETAAAMLSSRRWSGVLHLSMLEAPAPWPDEPAVLKASLARGPRALLRVLQALLQASSPLPELWVFAREPRLEPARAAALGLLKVVPLEETRLQVHAVGLEQVTAEPALLAQRIARELERGDAKEVFWVGEERQVPCIQPILRDHRLAALPWGGEAGCVLVAGGLSGVGFETCRMLARTTDLALVALHRSKPEVHAGAVRELEALGARVWAASADVCDLASVRAVVDEARRRFGAIRGVIHSAGVLQDRLLRATDPETFDRVVMPKSLGAWVLDQATRADRPSFFVLYSSMASLFCGPAQGAHVAANAFEDAFAAARRADSGLPTLSINWGVWAETGSVAHPRYQAALRAAGILPMPTARAIEGLRRVLPHPDGQVLISTMTAKLPAVGLPIQVAPPGLRPAIRAQLAQMLRRLPPQGPAQRLEEAAQRLTRAALEPWLRPALNLKADEETLASRLGVTPTHRRRFQRILQVLSAAGALRREPDGFQLSEVGCEPLTEALAACVKELPELRLALEVLADVLVAYPDMLTGRRMPLDVLFPGGDPSKLAALYRSPALFGPPYQLARAAAEGVAIRLAAAGRKLRVLEVGAGTGSTTEVLVPSIAQYLSVYDYTDVSPAFVRFGRQRFGAQPGMRFLALDLFKDFEPQGFQAAGYDLIIAANVVHTAPELRPVLSRLHRMLSPDGHLVLVEVTAPGAFGDLIFGLTDDWWGFRDRELRPESPCLPARRWTALLLEEGFSAAEAFPEDDSMAVVVAEAGDPPQLHPAAHPSLARAAAPARSELKPEQRAGGSSNDRARRIEAWLVSQLGEVLERPVDHVGRSVGFLDLGLDSLLATELAGRLSTVVKSAVSPTLFFEFPSVAALVPVLSARFSAWMEASEPVFHVAAAPALESSPDKTLPPVSDEPKQAIQRSEVSAEAVRSSEPIAIVGIGLRFPGADDWPAFWQLLLEGQDATSQVPPERWDLKRYHLPWASHESAIVTQRGGFLRDVYGFDPIFFKLSPAEAEVMDPQQRLLLEVAWEALEDAAWAGPGLRSRRGGVFVGAGSHQYSERFGLDDAINSQRRLDPGVGLGNSVAVLANRLSWMLNWRGPSLTVDTICSASLVAVHLAVQALRRGECELALAGGVHLHLSPSEMALESRLGALSPSGRCRTFDAAADGFSTGEGAAMVALKPLFAALRDGDRIYAVIRGSAMNHNGASSGLAAPSPGAQSELLEAALADAGVAAASIDYLEAHGTGTRLGDPLELQAAAQVFRGRRAAVGVGSVKSNLGHLEAAAGVAGLIKVALSLRGAMLPPSLHFQRPNPLVSWSDSPLYVVDRRMPWPVLGQKPRRAGVSSFGMGGANAHVVLEEAPPAALGESREEPCLMVLSARTKAALDRQIESLRSALSTSAEIPFQPPASLVDIARTLARGRDLLPHRVAFIASSRASFCEALARQPMLTGTAKLDRQLRVGVTLPQNVSARACDQLIHKAQLSPVWHTVLAEAGLGALGLSAEAVGPLAPRLLALTIGRALLSWGVVPTFWGGESVVVAALRGECSLVEVVSAPPSRQTPPPAEPLDLALRLELTGADPWLELLDALARLLVAGVDLDVSAINPPGQSVRLPTYPFERRRLVAPLSKGAEAAANPAKAEAPADLLWGLEVRPLPRVPGPCPRTWLLWMDGLGVLEALAVRLRARGDRVIVARRGTSSRRLGADRLVVADEGALTELLDSLEPVNGPLGVIHGAALGFMDLPDAEEMEKELLQNLMGLRRLIPNLPASARMWVVMNAAVALPDAPPLPHQAAMLAAVRVAAREWPALGICVIDLDTEAPPQELAQILEEELASEEILVDGLDHFVARRGDARLGLFLAQKKSAPAAAPWKAGGHYLITGGRGGMGTALAHRLLGHGAKVTLLGRTPGNDDGLSGVLNLVADITDEAALRSALTEARTQFGPILGVIHAAGVLRDEPLTSLTEAAVAAVLAPKLRGTDLLEKLTGQDPLEHFVVCSSLAAVFAPPGQAAHAAASAYESAWACRKTRQAGPQKTAILWGLWGDAGVAAASPIQHRIEQAGVTPLNRREALDALESALGLGQPEIGIARLNLRRLRLTQRGSISESAATSVDREQGSGSSLTVGSETKLAPRTPLPDGGEAWVRGARRAALTQPLPRGEGSDRQIRPVPEQAVAVPIPKPEGLPAESGALLSRIRELMTATLGLGLTELDPDLPFRELGIDSIRGVQLVQQLANALALELRPELLYQQPTLRQLSAWIEKQLANRRIELPAASPAVSSVKSLAQGDATALAQEPIAIVGLSCRFPGAPDPEAFWKLLAAGQVAIGEVPKDRWDVQALYDPRPGQKGRFYTRKGGFLTDVRGFDPLFFRISPRDARLMDPQQRLLLEVGWQALEDAGFAGAGLGGSDVGVFVGGTIGEYGELAAAAGLLDAGLGAGLAPSILANRISYALDLRGPSISVDTACSSSLVALHLACEALHRGDCGRALVGGVNLMLTPQRQLLLCAARMVSPTDRSLPFGAGADGYVRGEGVAAVVLKPLRRALADGDPIRAVIHATAVNQDGRTNGISAPNPDAQAALLRQAWQRAGLDPTKLGLVETHGTGTALGDPMEIRGLSLALSQMLGEMPTVRRSIALGAVKANIGHLESAAGLAGLLKAVLALEHGAIPPLAGFETLNPAIDLQQSPFFVPTRLEPWPSGARWAAVSSFGFGGTNAHVVLGESPARAAASPTGAFEKRWSGPHVLALSGRSQQMLQTQVRFAIEALQSHAAADVCRSFHLGRAAGPVRLAVVADDEKGLQAALYGSRTNQPLPASSTRGPVGARVEELAGLWRAGNDVDWQAWHKEAPGMGLHLPPTPLSPRPFWIEAPSRQWVVGWEAAPLPHLPRSSTPPRWAVAGVGLPILGAAAEQALTQLGLSGRRETAAERVAAAPAILWCDASTEIDLALACETRVGALYDLAVQIARKARKAETVPTELWVLSIEDGPAADAVGSLLRALPHEIPGLLTRQVRVQSAESGHDLCAELRADVTDAPTGSFAWRSGQRLGRNLRPESLGDSTFVPANCLITGGASGVGLELAGELVRLGCGRLALTGRASEAQRSEVLAQLRAQGAEVLYFAADATQLSEMQKVVTTLRARWDRIDAVIHGAGLFDASAFSLAGKDQNGWRQVLAPKVRGTVLLDQLLAAEPPRLKLALGSLAAISGPLSAGLADYAAANGFLEGMSRWAGWRVIHFGLWDGVGMGARSPGRTSRMKTLGIRPLSRARGLEAFRALLGRMDLASTVVLEADGEGDPRRWLDGRVPPLQAAELDVPGQGASPEAAAFVPSIPRGKEAAASLVLVQNLMSRLLQLQPREVDPDLPFADYGVDSLMIADFVGGLEAALGTPVNPTALVAHPTARRLAEWLAGSGGLRQAVTAGPTRPAESPRRQERDHAAEPDMLALLRAVAAGTVDESEALRRLRGRAP